MLFQRTVDRAMRLQQEQNAQGNKQPSPNEEHRGNKAAQTCDKDQDC